jgi:hypothetical protein
MSVFTFQLGALPAGLWLVLAFLVLNFFFGIAGQALSILAWDKARAWGLQEDDPGSADPLQRAYFSVEWGLALADVVVQSIAFVMALYGLYTRHWTGLLGASILFTILAYYGLAYCARVYAIKRWRLGDWTRWRRTAIVFLIYAEAIGLIGFIALWSNWRYFVG